MAKSAQTATKTPAMSDDAVKERTGKSWKQWFAALDKSGAVEKSHREIALLLHEKLKAPDWWCQMIAVEYERARGLRAVNQKCDGKFAVSVSKTLPVELSALYNAIADATQRKRWFPKGPFEISSQTRDKYFRGAWGGNGARLEVGFYNKGGKAQIALQVNKLASAQDVEPTRTAWKDALARLEKLLAE